MGKGKPASQGTRQAIHADDKRLTVKEWRALGASLYGEDMRDWKFRCPSCGYVQTIRDFARCVPPHPRVETVIAYSCIGRWMENQQDAFTEGPGPCNYAGGGLFRINPITIIMKDGSEVHRFAFADERP